MVRMKPFLFLPILICLFLPLLAQANEIRRFSIVIDDDFKNGVQETEDIQTQEEQFLAQVKLHLISNAVWNLIGNEVYQQNRSKIYHKILKNADRFLLSLEFSLKADSTGERIATGTVNVQKLTRSLLELSIPLKYMQSYSVGLIHRSVSPEVLDALRKHLSKFNIEIKKRRKLADFSPGNPVRFNGSAANSFFAEDTQLNVLYYLEHDKRNSGRGSDLSGVYSVSVWQKNADEPLHRFTVKESEFSQDDQVSRDFPDFKSYLLFRLNPVSLRTSAYEPHAVEFSLEILQPVSAEQAFLFENQFLKKSKSINGYKIAYLNSDKLVYDIDLIQNKRGDFIRRLQNSKSFSVVIEENQSQKITLNRLSFNLPKRVNTSSGGLTDSERATLRGYSGVFFSGEGSLFEKESNNTVYYANSIEVSHTLKGQISNRLDQDIFYLNVGENTSGLDFHLVFNLNSVFRLKLTLYDKNLNKLVEFDPAERPYQQFSYDFLAAKVPKGIYIRLEDKVGYIPRELGRVVPLTYYFFVKNKI